MLLVAGQGAGKHASRIFFLLGAAILFGLAFLFCLLIQSAFPYGIVLSDTNGYLFLAEHFHIFQFNGNDWIRTVPFGFLLRVSLLFPNPTAAVYWCVSVLFCTNMVLLFWMSCGLFRHQLIAWLFSFLLLLWEIAIGHVLLQHLFILADPLFASLTLMGMLLILGGWLNDRHIPSIIGYGILGIAIFTKPAGIAFIPAWTLFAFLSHGKGIYQRRNSFFGMSLALCLLLLIGPTFLWSARNFFIYGYFCQTASGGANLLPRVLPLLQNSDTVLDDPAENAAFIRATRTFESAMNIKQLSDPIQIYNDYMWEGTDMIPSPVQFLRRSLSKKLYGNSAPTLFETAKLNFDINTVEDAVSLRIIIAHPLAYAKMVGHDYMLLFSPLAALSGSIDWIHTPADEFYAYLWAHLNTNDMRTWYPSVGSAQNIATHENSRRLLARISDNPNLIRFISQWQTILLPWAIHLLLLGSLFALWKKRKRIGDAQSEFHVRVAVCLAMLCITAVSLNMLTSLVELGLARYALPVEIPMDMAVLLVLFTAALVAIDRHGSRYFA